MRGTRRMYLWRREEHKSEIGLLVLASEYRSELPHILGGKVVPNHHGEAEAQRGNKTLKDLVGGEDPVLCHWVAHVERPVLGGILQIILGGVSISIFVAWAEVESLDKEAFISSSFLHVCCNTQVTSLERSWRGDHSKTFKRHRL